MALRDHLLSLCTPIGAVDPEHIWFAAFNTIHCPPLLSLFGCFVRLCRLSAIQIGLQVRLKISKLMESLKLAPPPFNYKPILILIHLRQIHQH